MLHTSLALAARYYHYRTHWLMAIFDWFSRRVFNAVHRNNLVYNTCWEDPRLDRVAMQLTENDTVMVITSAGCNTLDYALCQPKHVHAVDMNPRQNALLQLKMAGIRRLEYEDFFRMFGHGYWPGVRKVYEQKLRGDLCDWSQSFWDKKLKFFENPKRSFYYRGTSGAFAKMVRVYVERVIKVRPEIDAILAADTVEEQREIYEKRLKQKFWTGLIKFTMRRDTTMSMLGVPKAQRRQIETQYEGGVVKYLQDSAQAVFAELPLRDNYFWRVYLNGRYTEQCCPEYLKPENFAALKNGLLDRISVHTDSVQGFLEKHDQPITRFVLLDHMDWLSDKFFPLLESEWQAIVNRASPQARILWRSGGLKTEFINDVKVRRDGKLVPVNELLSYHPELAAELHEKDRVHTYASFYIADVSA
jgi:S-adenosylmethionine-diacylglycerol 3-amino-3-carboxypropyl transferase